MKLSPPPHIATFLGWIRAAGLWSAAVKTVVKAETDDDAFIDLHELLIKENLCSEAMRIADHMSSEECDEVVNHIVLSREGRAALAGKSRL